MKLIKYQNACFIYIMEIDLSLGRHRAMGDVKAMVKIFTQTPLKNALHLMSVSTTIERYMLFSR